jgi:hypothetical protein
LGRDGTAARRTRASGSPSSCGTLPSWFLSARTCAREWVLERKNGAVMGAFGVLREGRWAGLEDGVGRGDAEGARGGDLDKRVLAPQERNHFAEVFVALERLVGARRGRKTPSGRGRKRASGRGRKRASGRGRKRASGARACPTIWATTSAAPSCSGDLQGSVGLCAPRAAGAGPPITGGREKRCAFTDSHRKTTRRWLQNRERKGGRALTRRRARSTGESGSRSWGRAAPRARPAAGGRRGGRSATMGTGGYRRQPRGAKELRLRCRWGGGDATVLTAGWRRCDCAHGGVEEMRLCSRRGG